MRSVFFYISQRSIGEPTRSLTWTLPTCTCYMIDCVVLRIVGETLISGHGRILWVSCVGGVSTDTFAIKLQIASLIE